MRNGLVVIDRRLMTLAVPRVRLTLPVSDARCQASTGLPAGGPRLTPAVLGVG